MEGDSADVLTLPTISTEAHARAVVDAVMRSLVEAKIPPDDILAALHAASCRLLAAIYGPTAPARYFGFIAKACASDAEHARLLDAARRAMQDGHVAGAA